MRRAILNGVFWVLGSGAHSSRAAGAVPSVPDLPPAFQPWIRSGKLTEALKLLAAHLHGRGRLTLDGEFVDATFASAKRGACRRSDPSGQGYT